MKRELLYITTIVQEKSISKAAQKLYISQPSLSHCVAVLEDKLGTKLFYRSTKGLSLTYAGEQYYHMAVEILARYNEFENELTEVNELKRGRITFGITNFLASHYLPSVLPFFAKKYPNIELIPCEASSLQLEQALLDRKEDFALMFSLPSSIENRQSPFKIEILKKESFVLAASPDDGLKFYAEETENGLPILQPEFFQNSPFILVSPEQRTRQMANHIFRKADIQPAVRLTTKNYETARRLCAQGMGVTILPYHSSFEADTRFPARYYRIPEQYEPFWYLTILTIKDGYVPLASRELMDTFRSIIAAEKD